MANKNAYNKMLSLKVKNKYINKIKSRTNIWGSHNIQFVHEYSYVKKYTRANMRKAHLPPTHADPRVGETGRDHIPNA